MGHAVLLASCSSCRQRLWMVCPHASTAVGCVESNRNSKHTCGGAAPNSDLKRDLRRREKRIVQGGSESKMGRLEERGLAGYTTRSGMRRHPFLHSRGAETAMQWAAVLLLQSVASNTGRSGGSVQPYRAVLPHAVLHAHVVALQLLVVAAAAGIAVEEAVPPAHPADACGQGPGCAPTDHRRLPHHGARRSEEPWGTW